MPASGFPPRFLWGAATSAYQVEGSPLADGAGPSNWHRFSHLPGRTLDGDTGDVACDHYRRYRDDVALMRDLGLSAYRFSLSWSRLLPQGTGAVNPAGVEHYSRVIDCLLEHGIEPFVTLYHWDLPAALEDRGGWLNPASVEWFRDYARVAFDAYDGRVRRWATLNEPWVVTDAGYLHGVHAPGHTSPREAALAAHHLLCAHGATVEAYRERGRHDIGIVINLEPKEAASDAAEDVAAAERSDIYMNRQFLDPLFLGRYPEGLAAMFGADWPHRGEPDLSRARAPIDFLGINYYKRGVMRRDDARPVERARHAHPEGRVYTDLGWEVFPEGLTRTLLWVRERYGSVPLYVTENGAAFADPPHVAGGIVDDPLRVDYLRTHLHAARAAIDHGVDLRGYFVWSLLDNFEWAQGYSKRFGIVHVDFESQQRTLKRSGEFYRDVVRSNGAALEGANRPASP